MKKRKTYEISVIDKTYSKIISDETKFYTSDTALELAFELKETEYNFDSAEIVLLNVDDRSLATRPVSKFNNDFVYEIDDDITTHYGDWRGQLMLVENGEVHVSSPIKFRIENDLYCNKPLEITEVVSWVGLKRYADSLVDELKQAVLSVDGVGDTFNTNETTRQNTFETNENERYVTFNTNEDIRQTQELEREKAESKRQTVFDDNEANRTETFNDNEATRQENEDVRIEAEKQREGTVAQIENRQDTVETQFNSIQQELTDKDIVSAPEIIAARNGKPNLKTRLDDDYSNQPLFLSDFGVKKENTASENSAIIKSVVAKAENEKRDIVFPRTFGEPLLIEETITINESITLSGYGHQSLIKKDTAGDMIQLHGEFSKANNFRMIGGNSQTVSGIMVRGHRAEVNHVSGDYLVFVVCVQSRDPENMQPRTVENVKVTNIESGGNVNFGLLVEGSRNLIYENISGSYSIQTNKAPHLVYFSDGEGTSDGPLSMNYNSIGNNLMAYDGRDSMPYQFRFMIGGVLNNVVAMNCEKMINTVDSKDFTVNNLTSIDDMNESTLYGSYEINTGCDNVLYNNIKATMSGGGKVIRLYDTTTNSEIRNPYVVGNSNASSTTEALVHYDGHNNKLVNPVVKNKKTNVTNILIFNGSENKIVNPETDGSQVGIRVHRGDDHQIYDFDKNKIKFVDIDGSCKPIEITPNPNGVEMIPSLRQQKKYDNIIAYDYGDMGTGSSNHLNRTPSGHTWVEVFGTWIKDEEGILPFFGNQATAVLDLGMTDISFKAEVRFRGEAIAMRVVDRHNFIGFKVRESGATLYKRIGKVETDYQTVEIPFSDKKFYSVEVQIIDDLVEVYINGSHIISQVLEQDVHDLLKDSTRFGLWGDFNLAGRARNLEWKKID